MRGTLSIYSFIEKLKSEILRKGWITRKISCKRNESVAEHCFEMSNLAMLIKRELNLNFLNMEKVYEMINIHEYGESIIGDWIDGPNVDKSKKHIVELEAVEHVVREHKDSQYFIDLWNEFEERKTKEAIFVFVIDKIQAVLQSKQYSKECNLPELFIEFYDDYKKRVIEKDEFSISKILEQ